MNDDIDDLIEEHKEKTKILVDQVKKHRAKIKEMEAMGIIEETQEIGPNCIFHLIECVLYENSEEVSGWNFHQVWFDRIDPDQQRMFENAYVGEIIDNYKILSIYKPGPHADYVNKL